MGVSGQQVNEKNMAAITGVGKGYWMVDGSKESGVESGIIPEAMKELPGPPTEQEEEKRREEHSKWAVEGCGTEPPLESEFDATDAASQWRGTGATIVINTSAEVWGAAHVVVVIIYQVNFLVLALWQLMVWLINIDTKYEEDCTRLKTYYITSSIGTMVVAPFVFYICSCTLLELQSKLTQKILAGFPSMSDDRPKPISEIWLSWGPGKILVACIVCVSAVFQLSWWLAGIAWIVHSTACGDFTEQGENMILFSSIFITCCATISAIGAVAGLRKSQKPPASIPASSPAHRVATPTNHSPHSPKNTARVALKALKDRA